MRQVIREYIEQNKKNPRGRVPPLTPVRLGRGRRGPQLSGFSAHQLAHACRIASGFGENESFKAAMLEAANHFENCDGGRK